MNRKEAHAYRPPGKCKEDGDGYRLVMPLSDHIDTIDAIYNDLEKDISEEKENAKQALLLVLEDIEMFFDGSWTPDNDSMEDTESNVQIALNYLLKENQCD